LGGIGDKMHNKEEQRDEDSSMSDGPPRAGDASLSVTAQETIGRKLREVYGQLLCEPLPDRFSALLDKLAKSEKNR
jgi:Anti-sigma factor NepR